MNCQLTRNALYALCVCVLIGSGGRVAAQCTHFVPNDFPEIQDAIDAASNGDVICVDIGTYAPIDLQGKQLQIEGAGPGATFIEGGSPTVLVASGEPAGTQISAVTIRQGSGVNGGGIRVENSHLSLAQVTVVDNIATNFGGGLFIGSNSTVTISASFIGDTTANNTAGVAGGSIYAGGDNISLTITNDSWIQSGVAGHGGGIALELTNSPPPLIIDSWIVANKADIGAGLYNRDIGVEVRNTFIAENEAFVAGGGAAFEHLISMATFDNTCTFWQNVTNQDGGGFAVLESGWVHFHDTLFFRNGVLDFSDPMNVDIGTDSGRGGGGYIGPNVIDVQIVNCEFDTNKAESGGGLYNHAVIDLLFGPQVTVHNSEAKFGGGFWHSGSHLHWFESTIEDNDAYLGGGGYNRSELFISTTNFLNNRAVDPLNSVVVAGGGIYQTGEEDGTVSAHLVIHNCVFDANETSGGLPGAFSNAQGGGIHQDMGTSEIVDTTFMNNIAADRGGGLHLNAQFGTTEVDRCQFHENVAGGSGGAVSVNQPSPFAPFAHPIITNSLFADNDSATFGGGVFAHLASTAIEVVNCTFFNNTGQQQGHALAGENTGLMSMYNTIAWADPAPAMGDQIWVGPGMSMDLQFSNVFNHLMGPLPGPGNMELDPQFANSAAGNLRLAAHSPLIDMGFSALLPPWATFMDLDGNSRISGAEVDMGAYELQPPCPADISGPAGAPDGVVDVFDLLMVISEWGTCANPANCPADISGPGGVPDGVVDVFDLLAVIAEWGTCP